MTPIDIIDLTSDSEEDERRRGLKRSYPEEPGGRKSGLKRSRSEKPGECSMTPIDIIDLTSDSEDNRIIEIDLTSDSEEEVKNEEPVDEYGTRPLGVIEFPSNHEEDDRQMIPLIDITSDSEEETETQVKKEKPVKVITETELMTIAKSLGNKWKELALQLNIGVYQVEDIQADNSNDTIEYTVTKMLVRWKNGIQDVAELRMKLVEALRNIERHDLANCVKDMKYPPARGESENIPNVSNSHMIMDTEDDITENMGEKSRQDGAVIENLKNTLSAKYKELDDMEPNLGNPIHHTLSNNYVEVNLKQKKDGRCVKPDTIMQNRGERKIRKILIQGRTGFGKTTFCKKLVHDWVISRDAVLVGKIPFFLKVHELVADTNIPACQGGVLRQAIFQRLIPVVPNVKLTHDEIWSLIQSTSGEFAFIIDGLGEASEEVLNNLKEVINGGCLPFSTIIVTSTTDIFQDDVKFDSHLVLEGFSESQIKECVKNSFKNRSCDVELFIKEVSKSNLMELMECPLFSVLLSLMWQEPSYSKLNSTLPSSWTDLLMQFNMFLVRRYERKKKHRKSANYDNFKDMPQSYINMMSNIGKAALDTLTTKSQTLKLNQEDAILAERIGLITQSTIVTPLKVIPSYVPIHKIMLDFLAALYLKNTSEAYPVNLLLANNMMMVAKFLTGLLDREGNSSDLLQLFVDNRVQNYNLTSACVEECRPTNKKNLLNYLGNIVSKHTYLDLGFIGKESRLTDTLGCLYTMFKEIKPSEINIMKIEASEVFFESCDSAVTFAKLVKCIPKLIAINFPRFMLSSHTCSVINELKRGHQKYMSMEKISLVSNIDSTQYSEKVVEMLTFFPRLNEIVLQVRMNAEASSRFLKGVCYHIAEKSHILENVEVLDLSFLNLGTSKDCENLVTIFSKLQKLKRLIIPRRMLKHLYPRYYRNVQNGKYILHKMPLLPNVKLSVFLQIDVGRLTENPTSTITEVSYNPLSCSDLRFGALSVPELHTPYNTSFRRKMSRSTICDISVTMEGLLLMYWDDTLVHERALHPGVIGNLSPSAVFLHPFKSGNPKIVAQFVDQIRVEKVMLNDASLMTFPKMGSVTLNGIKTVDLADCTMIEKAVDAIHSFPNLKTINLTENMNPVSLLQELTNSEKQLDIQQISLSFKSESSIEVLKSMSIQLNDVCVSQTSIILKNQNRCPPVNNVSILLERDEKLLMNLTGVKRILFQGDSYRFLNTFSMLLDKSRNGFKNLTAIEFVNGEGVDTLSNEILSKIRLKIGHTCPLLPKELNSINDPISKSLHCPTYNDQNQLKLKSLGDIYDEVYLNDTELTILQSSVGTSENQSHKYLTFQSDPKLLLELPHIKKLTIEPARNQMLLFRSWLIALEEQRKPHYYKNLQILDLKGTRFRSCDSLKMLAKVMEYTPNLQTIMNAKVESCYRSNFRKFLIENKLEAN